MNLDTELINLREETKKKVLELSEELGGNIAVGDEYQTDIVKKNSDMIIDISEVLGDYSTTYKAEEIKQKLKNNDITYFVRENRNEKNDTDKIESGNANIYSKNISLIPFSEVTDIVPSRKMEKIWIKLINISRAMLSTVKEWHNNSINSNEQFIFTKVLEDIIHTSCLKPSKPFLDFIDISTHMILWSINEVYNSVPILSKELYSNIKQRIINLDNVYKDMNENINEWLEANLDNETDFYNNLKRLKAKKELFGDSFNPGVGFVGNRVILYDSIEAEKNNIIKVSRTTNKNEILRALKEHTSETINGLMKQNKLNTDLEAEIIWEKLENDVCLLETVEIPSDINMIGDTAFYRMNCYYENVTGYKRSIIRIIKLNKAYTKFIAINNCDRDRLKASEQLINKNHASFCDKATCKNEDELIDTYKETLNFVQGIGTIWDINWEDNKDTSDSEIDGEIKLGKLTDIIATFKDREYNSTNKMTKNANLGYKLAEKYTKAEKEIKELNSNTLEHYKLLLIKLVNSTYTSLIAKQLRNNNETIKLLLSEELNRLNNSKAEKAASLKIITTANIGNQLKEILKSNLTEEEKIVVENLFNSRVISEEVEELNKALEETHKAIRSKNNLKILIESTDNETLQLYRKRYFDTKYCIKLDTNRLTQFYYKDEKPILVIGSRLNLDINNEIKKKFHRNLSSFFINKYVVDKINVRTAGNINVIANELDTVSAIDINNTSEFKRFRTIEALLGIDELHLCCFNVDRDNNTALRFIMELTESSITRLGFSANSAELTNELSESIDYCSFNKSLPDFARSILFEYPDSIARYEAEHLRNEEEEKFAGLYKVLGVREANKLKRSLQGK